MEGAPARKLRKVYNVPGHAHELTFSTFHRFKILRSATAANHVLESIKAAREATGFKVFAYVIMPDHAHILIWHPNEVYSVSDFLYRMKRMWSRAILADLRQTSPELIEHLKVVRSGKVEYRCWEEGGGYDRNIFSPDAIRNSIEYIHANPVRKNLVASPAEYEWSSANAYESIGDLPGWVDRFGFD